MILKSLSRSLPVIALAFLSSPAAADVLEIDDNGAAHWIAGGPEGLPETVSVEDSEAANSQLKEVSPEITVPPEAIASPAQVDGLIPPQYAGKVAELSQRFDLSPALIEALVWQESRWRPNAVSPVGARGLAQLMPGTARELGVDSRDPLANLEGGARYLREQLDRFDGNLEKALAAYNAGPGRVIAAKGIPRIRETQKYVAAIMGRLASHSRSDN